MSDPSKRKAPAKDDRDNAVRDPTIVIQFKGMTGLLALVHRIIERLIALARLLRGAALAAAIACVVGLSFWHLLREGADSGPDAGVAAPNAAP